MSETDGNQGVRFGKHRTGCACAFCAKVRAQLAFAADKEARGLKVRRRLRREKSNLTLRQQRFVGEFADPTSPAFRNAAESARLSGYSEQAAPNIGAELLRNQRVQRAILAAFEAQGVTPDRLAQVVAEGLSAEETRYFAHDGRVTDERRVPDWHSRHKFAETALRVRGDYRNEGGPTAALILRVPDKPLSVEEWNRALEEGKLSNTAPPAYDEEQGD